MSVFEPCVEGAEQADVAGAMAFDRPRRSGRRGPVVGRDAEDAAPGDLFGLRFLFGPVGAGAWLVVGVAGQEHLVADRDVASVASHRYGPLAAPGVADDERRKDHHSFRLMVVVSKSRQRVVVHRLPWLSCPGVTPFHWLSVAR